MTNLLNVLKTMETETTGVKNDVINYLLEFSQDSEDLQTHLEDINNYGCESGQVNHLIYYKDTVKYFEKHENEIMEMLEELGIEDVESWDGLQELSDIFPQLDGADTRHIKAEEEVLEIAMNEAPSAYGDEWDEMDEDEQMEAIQDYASSIMMYESNPMELTDYDKNCLAWTIFEYEAVNLDDELSEMEVL